MTTIDNRKPFSIVLGSELKPFLQGIAQSENRSLGNLIRRILMDYKKEKEVDNTENKQK